MRATIGPFPAVTLAEARRRAAAIVGDLAKGSDPTQAGRRHRKAPTFADLSERWLTEHAFVHKRTGERDRQALALYLSAWNNRRVLEITRADVERLYARIGENHGRYTANRTLALLSAMFGKAVAWGVTDNNPARGIRRFPELARDRFLMPDEIKRLIGALAQDSDQTFQLFVLLSLLTGQRRGNVLAMRRRDIHGIDSEAPVWRIPAAEFKNGRVHVVPLVPSLVWFLRDRRRDGEEYVLPGRDPGQHHSEPKRRWIALLKRAGLGEFGSTTSAARSEAGRSALGPR